MNKPSWLILAVWILTGCSKAVPLEKFSKVGEFFGSTVRVDVCYDSDQHDTVVAAVDDIWARFADIHWRLSVYDPKSDLNRINQSFPDPVTVGADTHDLIRHAMDDYALSGGVFDITIYPLLKVWKAAEKRGALPTQEEIRSAQALMGMDTFELLDNNQVRLKHQGAQLSIDSIADGYAADEAGRILREHGFSRFLVDASGELLAGGLNCDGHPWRVGVKDPDDFLEIMDVLAMKDESVTTSGNYGHFYTIDGQQYSHIINPKTGFPREDIVSVTVIAPSAEFSDFLSTALCLMDPQEGLELVDSLGEGYAAMIVIREKNGGLTQKFSSRYQHDRVVRD